MKKLALPKLKRPGKRAVIWTLLLVVLIATVIVGCNKFKGDEKVKFRVLGEDEIPAQISQEIMPEYKQLERALACMVDETVYVIATRGEKPTSGYGVRIDKMKLEERDGLNKLVVYAVFTDPKPGEVLSQVLTYPYQVTSTALPLLPDEIELKVNYED